MTALWCSDDVGSGTAAAQQLRGGRDCSSAAEVLVVESVAAVPTRDNAEAEVAVVVITRGGTQWRG